MRKTQGSPQMQQQLKAGDKNEYKPYFFFFYSTKEIRIFIFTQLFVQSYTQRGEEHAKPPTFK